MVREVVVLGGGSAGLLTALTLKVKLPRLSVRVLRSKEMGVIGVGEGTMPDFPELLFGYLKIDPSLFHREAAPTPKLGIRFLWGPRPAFNFAFGVNVLRHYKELVHPTGYYCHDDMEHLCEASSMMSADKAWQRAENGTLIMGHELGYHIENQRFVAFLESYAARAGVEILDETIEEVRQDERGISALVARSGNTYCADLFIDSSGFQSLLLGKTLAEPFIDYKDTLFCDRAVVGPWDRRPDEPIRPYTTAETMDAGWCWQVEHEDRIARGYVYSSSFISDEQAEIEFREKNPRLTNTRIVKFRSGRFRNSWVKNVVAVGNASGFVEPLEATSLAVICREARRLAETLRNCDLDPGPASARAYNLMAEASWDGIRDFLAVHYRYNTRLDTPFWKACRADVQLHDACELVSYYQEEGPNEWGTNIHSLTHSLLGFTPDSYYTILLGQRVPYRRIHAPSADELRHLEGIRAQHRRVALAAIPAKAALPALRHPQPGWDAAFYAQPAG